MVHTYFRLLPSWWSGLLVFMKWPSLSLVILFVLKFALSDINLVSHVLVASYIFFLSLSLSSKHIDEIFLIFNSLWQFNCLLMGMFSPFTFNIVTDNVGYKSTILLWYVCLLRSLVFVPSSMPSSRLTEDFSFLSQFTFSIKIYILYYDSLPSINNNSCIT